MAARYLLLVLPKQPSTFAVNLHGAWSRKRDAIRDARALARQGAAKVGVYRTSDGLLVFAAEAKNPTSDLGPILSPVINRITIPHQKAGRK